MDAGNGDDGSWLSDTHDISIESRMKANVHQAFDAIAESLFTVGITIVIV